MSCHPIEPHSWAQKASKVGSVKPSGTVYPKVKFHGVAMLGFRGQAQLTMNYSQDAHIYIYIYIHS
jgi:hypothetical protein